MLAFTGELLALGAVLSLDVDLHGLVRTRLGVLGPPLGPQGGQVDLKMTQDYSMDGIISPKIYGIRKADLHYTPIDAICNGLVHEQPGLQFRPENITRG